MKFALLGLLLVAATPVLAQEKVDLSHDEGAMFEYLTKDMEYVKNEVSDPEFIAKLEAAGKDIQVRHRAALWEHGCSPDGKPRARGYNALHIMHGFYYVTDEVRRAAYRDFLASLNDTEVGYMDRLLNGLAPGFSLTYDRHDVTEQDEFRIPVAEMMLDNLCRLRPAEAEAEKQPPS